MHLGEGSLITAAETPDSTLCLLTEDGPRVRDLLDLQRLLLRCQSSSSSVRLCVSYI